MPDKAVKDSGFLLLSFLVSAPRTPQPAYFFLTASVKRF